MMKMIALLTIICSFSQIAIAQSSEIIIQALNGKDGTPLIHQHLLIFGGETAEAASFHHTHFEATTDERGFARVPFDLATTRWIELFADYLTLCHRNENLVQFNVDEILSTGLATPNGCGKVTQQPKPGQFIVFARRATLREKMAR